MIEKKDVSAPIVPLSILFLYALGQMGWSLAAYGATNLLNYFYIPPETVDNQALFPNFIFTGAILGILTLLGLLNAGGRIFDAFTDPMIATWTDQSTSNWGKRRKFMLIAFLPFAILSALVFFPPFHYECTWNTIYLTIVTFLFYFFMTLYVIPYTALISELGHSTEQRLLISTFISVAFALGFGIGQLVYLLQGILENYVNSVTAFQIVITAYASLSAILMVIPIIFVDEQKYCQYVVTPPINRQAALKSVWSNRNFRFFALSDLTYWIALTFILTGMVYYLMVLLELDKSAASIFMPAVLSLSFLFYLPINWYAKKKGKKGMMLFAFLAFSIVFGSTFLMDAAWSISPYLQGTFLLLLAVIPTAIFSILPNAIIADIIAEDALKTGIPKAAMFYGMRSLMMKLGIAIANFLFPSLLLLGKSATNDTGIRLTCLVAMGFSFLGCIFFTQYREKELIND